MKLEHCSNDELLANLRTLVGSHRDITARLITHLAEVEHRSLHLLAGYSSMFDFCTKALRMSEGEAFRRIAAARLSRRFPLVVDLLAAGAVHLSALTLLRERLTAENHVELLEAAAGKSKREVERLLAARFPRPDVPSQITEMRLEPLSKKRVRVEFTASFELREKLERCRELMSHANPSGDLGIVIERAVELLLGELERKRLGRTKRARAERPKRGGTPTPSADSGTVARKSRHIARSVRRDVHERDGSQCTYVAPDGRRCEARAFLEFDHVEPRARGGTDDAENLRVFCRAHNQLAAEEAFGRDYVERRRHLRQQKSSASSTDEGAEQKSAA